MHRRKILYLLPAIISAAIADVGAVKAKPGIVDYQQPDGTHIEIILHGDENSHYATTPDGIALILDQTGRYVEASSGKAEITRSKRLRRLVDKTTRSGEPKYRFSSSAFPASGAPHSLVVLVEYPDYSFSIDNPLEYYEDFLNGDDFSRDGATGSVRKYYSENSNGSFTPTFDVYGPVRLKNERKYYGAGYYDENACLMVVEAVEALDPEVDFSQYDHNGDGFVDSIYLIYSDKGANDGGPSDSVWPFSWELLEDGIELIADGVQFNTYGCSNELKGNGTMEGIGTFTHEFGHVLGLPDLYHTLNSYDMTTPGAWSLMDNGNYNNNSRTPCNLSSFERYSLGWLQPEEIVADGQYELDNLATCNKAFIMTSEEKNDEFFIMDYRLQEGWDEYLPYHGLLIWHIDFRQQAWDNNIVNNNMAHQYVDLVRADNDKMAIAANYKGDPFPGIKENTEFSIYTQPALLTWAAKELNTISLYNIREEVGKVRFSVKVKEFRGEAGVDCVGVTVGLEIIDNKLISHSGSHPVYDLTGRVVSVVTPERAVVLSPGLYIVSGSKILIR